MENPSPAPRRPRRRLWPWLFAAGGLLLVCLLVAMATYPMWAAGWVRGRLQDSLEARLGRPVSIGGIVLDYDAVHVSELYVPGEGSSLELTRVDVQLDPDLLWSGRAHVTGVSVTGGEVRGSRAALEQLARDLVGDEVDDGGAGESASWWRRRVRLRPQILEIEGLQVDVVDGPRALRGRARVSMDLEREAAAVELANVEASLSPELELAARGISTELARDGDTIAFPLTLVLDGAATRLTDELAVAEVDGTITVLDARASELAVDLSGGFAGETGATGELWSVEGQGKRDFTEGRVTVEMERFELGKAPEVLASLPLVDSEEATVAGRVTVDLAEGLADIDGRVSLTGLNVSHRMLASRPIRGVGFDARVQARLDPARRHLSLEKAVLSRGGVSMTVTGDFDHPEERTQRKYRAHARVEPVACQRVLEAIPPDLVPALQGFVLGGDFNLDVRVDVDFADLEALTLQGLVDIWGCDVLEVPEKVSAARLSSSFVHRARMRDGRTRSVNLFYGSGTFTPLSEISPNMVAAVLTTEDGGFWKHDGFRYAQFEEALRRNLAAGKIRLGASTISMQVVKNVLLSHERTLSRKLQEMFLTWYLEQSLSKRRIMEIYLNVIEFGPGIYGVTRAAEHYFGKRPGELTSLEAAYLALMLPSPVRRHVYYCQGELSKSFEVKLRRIHGLMHSRGKISTEEYLIWKDEPLVFDLRERAGQSECLGEIDALMRATEGQAALSGLGSGGGPSVKHERVSDQEVYVWPPPLPAVTDPADQAVGDPALLEGLMVEDDPAMADAPGTPAMDDPPL